VIEAIVLQRLSGEEESRKGFDLSHLNDGVAHIVGKPTRETVQEMSKGEVL
jgi:hypothetical protein